MSVNDKRQMFIKKVKPSVVSPFFEGDNILNKGVTSLYGKFVNTISNIMPRITENDEFDKSYKIPTVIVIGAESSGKSSLLENITKCPIFPKNNKICTKLPIILQLHPAQNESDIEYSYTFREETVITDKNKISKQICDIMKGFDSNTIINEALTVVIKDIGLPHFNFVDLPGIRVYDEEMARKTYDLSEQYIKQPDTIVLCVIPATIPRITSYSPIALIKKHNKMKDTIIALTMCDRVQEENIYDLIVQRITLESEEFQSMEFAGCTGVINRSNNTVSLNDNGKLEMEWFEQNIISCIDESCDYAHIKNNLGVNVLINNIDVIYNKYINDIWIPKTIKFLENLIDKEQKNIDELGEKYMKKETFDYDELIRKIITLLLSKFDVSYSVKNFEIKYNVEKTIPEALMEKNCKITKNSVSNYIDKNIKIFKNHCQDKLEMYINNDFDILPTRNGGDILEAKPIQKNKKTVKKVTDFFGNDSDGEDIPVKKPKKIIKKIIEVSDDECEVIEDDEDDEDEEDIFETKPIKKDKNNFKYRCYYDIFETKSIKKDNNNLKYKCYYDVIKTNKKFNIQIIQECLNKNDFLKKISKDATEIIKLYQNYFLENDHIIEIKYDNMLIKCLCYDFKITLEECLDNSFDKKEIIECEEDVIKRSETLALIDTFQTAKNKLTKINC